MGKKARKKRKEFWKSIMLLALIYFAYQYMNADEDATEPIGANSYLEGEWQAQTDGYEDIKVVIDADSLAVYEGEEILCDEEYDLNERTLLITGAYRQDFELFALFEYRGEDGRTALIGNVVLEDGSHEEVYFSKNQTGSGRLK